jgi:WD40 repeat protein
LELKWGSDTDFVGVGNKAMVMWKVGTGKPAITKSGGKFGKVTNKLCSVTSFGPDYICGAAEVFILLFDYKKGFVCIFQGGSANEKLSVNTNHKGTVECVASSKDFIMSGGMDGKIVIYDKTYAVLCDI